jgi:hypothetical protein
MDCGSGAYHLDDNDWNGDDEASVEEQRRRNHSALNDGISILSPLMLLLDSTLELLVPES